MRKKSGITLIELIAVLVILLIIALIVTPLVLNVINKAKTSANKRSVDAYGRSVEIAISKYLLNTNEFPTNFEVLDVEYSGENVACEVKELNSDGTISSPSETIAIPDFVTCLPRAAFPLSNSVLLCSLNLAILLARSSFFCFIAPYVCLALNLSLDRSLFIMIYIPYILTAKDSVLTLI